MSYRNSKVNAVIVIWIANIIREINVVVQKKMSGKYIIISLI